MSWGSRADAHTVHRKRERRRFWTHHLRRDAQLPELCGPINWIMSWYGFHRVRARGSKGRVPVGELLSQSRELVGQATGIKERGDRFLFGSRLLEWNSHVAYIRMRPIPQS